MIVRRKRADLLDRKPGAIYSGYPVLIFVRMIRRPVQCSGRAKSVKIYSLRAKFNDALNDAVAKIDQRIMTINSCFTEEHFDHWGNLSLRGKRAMWLEIDDLLERFNRDEVKLLPTPDLKKRCPNKKKFVDNF